MAKNVLPIRPVSGAASLEHAEVKGGSGHQFMVQLAQGLVAARTAVSCLVRPESGDKVLVSSNGQDHYILAVLARTDSSIALHFPGETTLNSVGPLKLHSNEGVTVASAEAVNLTAQTLRLTAIDAQVSAQSLGVNALTLKADHDEVEFRARTVSSWAQRVFQRADTVVRWVEGVETAHIGQLVKNIRQAYLMNAQNTVITARGDVKIDGERIHMG